MQGDKIGEESGKVISQRVLPNPGGGPKMETSFLASGTILGTSHTTRGTMRPPCGPMETCSARARASS